MLLFSVVHLLIPTKHSCVVFFQKLTSLDLSGAKISPRCLSSLLQQSTKLRHLNLSGTKCNDQVLSTIGRF